MIQYVTDIKKYENKEQEIVTTIAEKAKDLSA
jgi:hypothetical protein